MGSLLHVETAVLRPLLRPRAVAVAATVAVAVAGWAVLSLMVLEMAGRGVLPAARPGMGLFDTGSMPDMLLAFGRDALVALCGPNGLSITAGAGGLLAFSISFAMWAAMTAAMMVPTASPLFSTYGDIAEAAREGGKPVVTPLVLIAGYAAAWLGFCAVAAPMQMVLSGAGLLSDGIRLQSPLIGAGGLAGAALYQLSPLKLACLTKCRSPFSFLFANWTDRPAGVFMLGLRQGLACIGCCWALMVVMFCAGLMNVVWMALLAIVMTLEKIVGKPQVVVRLSAAVLFCWAALLAAGLIG